MGANLTRGPGPLTTKELKESKVQWVKKVQAGMSMELQSPGWEVFREVDSGLLKCKGRILSYQPIYLEEGEFVDKLNMHTHNEIDHALRYSEHHGCTKGELVDPETTLESQKNYQRV